jgi:outer membrane protein TolC
MRPFHALCLAALLPMPAWADSTNAATRPLSLSDCFHLALEHNLDVKIARCNPEMQSHNLAAAYGAYEPALGMSASRDFSESPGGLDSLNRPYSGTTAYGDSFVPGLTGILPTGASYSFGGTLSGTAGSGPGGSFINDSGQASFTGTQPLLRNSWIDGPREVILIDKKALKMSELALRRQIMTTLTSVELAYYNLILARERINVQRQALQLAERLVNESKAKVAAGSMAPFDEKQAESQLSASRSDLLGAQGAMATQDYNLKNLLSDKMNEWSGLPIEPTEKLEVAPRNFDLTESWRRGLALRPDFLQAKTGLEQQGVVLKYLRNQIYPELDVVGSYAQAGSASTYNGVLAGIQAGTSPSWSVGLQLTLPLAGNRAARETYRANKVQLKQQTLLFKQLEQNIMVEIGISVDQARASYGQADATHQSRLFAEAALEAAQKQLDNGRTTSFVVVQLQRDLTTARLAELTAIAQYNEALSNLAYNEGTTLQRDKLELAVK